MGYTPKSKRYNERFDFNRSVTGKPSVRRELEYDIYRFSREIVVIAKEGTVGDWAAYIGTLEKGEVAEAYRDAPRNWKQIAREGVKIPYKVAKVLFPNFDKKYKWRS